MSTCAPSSRLSRATFLAALAFAVALPGGFVLAASPKDSTVNLYCQMKSGNRTYSVSGTGSLISERGVILTNAHVAQYFLLQGKKIKGSTTCSVRTGSPAREAYSAEAVHVSTDWLGEFASTTRSKKSQGSGEYDFALLRVTGAASGTLPASFAALPPDFLEAPVEGQEVTIAAYPSGDLSFSDVRRKLKRVVVTTTVEYVGSYGAGAAPEAANLAPSDAGAPGASGSPVVNAGGEVIGVITSKSATKENRTTRAITLPYVDRLLRAQTGLAAASILSGDLAQRAALFQAGVTSGTLKAIARNFVAK